MSEATGPQDVVAELHGLAELARISRLGVNVLDPATFTTAAATIVHLRSLDARRQQEIERLLARIAELETVTTVSQALDEDRRDRAVTDIVTRLRALATKDILAGTYDADTAAEAADEIERLRADNLRLIGSHGQLMGEADNQRHEVTLRDREIDLLRREVRVLRDELRLAGEEARRG